MKTERSIEIPSLDGLRAVSIALVFGSHAGASHWIPGGLGVTVFFVVSGYLITTLLRLEFERSGRVSIGGFYLRRVFRILPLFYAVLTLAVIGTVFFGLGLGRIDGAATSAQYLHVANYFGIFWPEHQAMLGTGVYWSLAVEEHFYLVFPLLFALLNRWHLSSRRQAVWLIGICGAVLAWRLLLVVGLQASELRTYYATDTRIDSILIGCALAIAANPMLDPLPPERLVRRRAGAAMVVLLLTLVVRDTVFRETFRYSIQSVAIAAILVFVVAAPASRTGRILNQPTIVAFGRLSFAFYLVHQIVIAEVTKHLSTLPAVPVSLAISVAVSIALQRAVERPSARLRNRVLARRRESTKAYANKPA